ETQIARDAAFTLIKLKGSAIWRRLVVIAFEDIGIGSVEALIMTVAAGSDGNWRKSCGGDPLRLAVYLATLFAEAAKDRSADYIYEAKDHPELTGFVHAVAEASLEHRLSHVHDKALGLPQRAVAALSALSTESHGEVSRAAGGLDALLITFRELGVPEELVVA